MKLQQKVWDAEYKQNASKWNKETKNLPKIFRGKKVLEIGVGNGKTLKAILKQGPSEVSAIDFSREAILQCRTLFNQFPNVEFKEVDLADIDFKNNNFDIAVCYYVFNNIPKKQREKAANEIYRVLKKNGKLIFEDFSSGDFRQENQKNSKLTESNTILKRNGLICHFFIKSEIKQLFRNFSKVKLQEKSTSPIIHKPNLKRKIISGIFVKQK